MLTYKKGLRNDPLREELYDIIENGDCLEISGIVRQINPQRLPVDINIFATKSRDLNLLYTHRIQLPTDQEFEDEVQFVYDLSQQRDADLTTLTHLPRSFHEVSWFLRDYEITPYQTGEDFLTTQIEWNHIQVGNFPNRTVTLEEPRLITTLRDAAVAVHADDPYVIWGGVLKDLLRHGVAKTRGLADVYQADFACFGYPHLMGIMADAMSRIGLLSFRNKWKFRIARPEEFYSEAFSGFLPQAFPEGSPTHPSLNAMHSAIHWTAAYVVLRFFDDLHVLPDGNTVRDQVELLASNMSDWRSAAGVHYPFDNICMKPTSKALAEKVVAENM